ncbi:putative signaling protein [Thalassocella blandensis]|nr:putative signaling protein [Thalassocella blandensis]
MKLRSRFLLIIVSATCICIAGVLIGFAQEVLRYSKLETEKNIFSSKLNFVNAVNQLTETASSSAILIAEDDLIARYFSVSESNRFSLLSPAIHNYLKTVLSVYPYFEEISLLLEDGYEEARVAHGVKNKSDKTHSAVIQEAWLSPDRSFINFEFHEDFDRYTLNVYRAIAIPDRSQSARNSTVRTVVRIAISMEYVESLAWQQLMTKQSFILIHDGHGGKILHSGSDIPDEITHVTQMDADIDEEQLNSLHLLLETEVIFDNWFLVVAVPMEAALQQVKSISVKGGITLLVFFVILGLSVYAMLSYFVIQPVDDLVKATNRFAETGELPEITARNDEIGALQNAFLDMGEKLDAQTNSLKVQAYTDVLTGLPNRNLLAKLLRNAVEKSERSHRKVGLLFIDLDGFKQVNDVLGHNAGDALLQKVAERLSGILRVGDSVTRIGHNLDNVTQSLIRLGGDEFTVILPELRVQEDAALVAERLLDQFQYPFRIQGKEVFVGASMGIAIYPDDAKVVDSLVKFADTAMYAAKKAGKMRYMFFNRDMFNESKARLELENVLHHAFAADEFKVAYQAKVDPLSNKVIGFEALARLETRKMGVIPPVEFIPVAEKSGMIDNITLLLIDKICQQIVVFQQTLKRDFTMAINISPVQLSNNKLFNSILDIVKRYSIEPHLIEFEVTENSLIDNETLAEQQLGRLKTMGFRTALDDFGVGYSSLGHLKRFEFDTLKIDRMFFSDVETNPNGKTILVSIIDLARKLGMDIVAEGIESQEQIEFVTDNGIDMVQGYFYAKPIYAEFLAEDTKRIESASVRPLKIKA